MALTLADVASGSPVQVDDGTHLTVFVQNVGRHRCLIDPGDVILPPGQSTNVNVVGGTPLFAYAASSGTTTIAYAASGSQPDTGGAIPRIDCGGAA